MLCASDFTCGGIESNHEARLSPLSSSFWVDRARLNAIERDPLLLYTSLISLHFILPFLSQNARQFFSPKLASKRKG
ncbi:hypothetical protein K1719_036313 [Acacia pycnantha]|nr:hypothetical protein K1719_036313 [Acacia pycnantha]